MIQVTIGTNTNRKKVTVNPESTIRQVLEDNDVNYSVATVHMDGATLQPGDMDKTFKDFGITDSCYVIAVVKADNAR
jgi:hypothetical protein